MNRPRNNSNLLAKEGLIVSLISLALFSIAAGPTPGQTQSGQGARAERSLKVKDFKDIPVAVSKVKNLNSETWHKDLEIEVKNHSDKPIYFIGVYLIFPDEAVPSGKSGILLLYGDPKNAHISWLADPVDKHLNPGESYVFTIPEMYRKG